MSAVDEVFAKALGGRGFGPGGKGAPPAPAKALPRTVRNEEIEIGKAGNGDAIGLDLAKLIEGRLLIQGNSGAGKSMLLRRIFEQAFGRVQQLIVDADGEFSTLAEVFDVAIIPAAEVSRIGGRVFASHLREHRYSAVLDLSDATSEDRLSLVADLADGLIGAPQEHWHPLLVHIDEAQTLAPHYDTGDIDADTRKRAIATLADLMGRGRKRGLAGVIATQRLAETAKAVVSKATNIIVGRTVFDRDLERAGALLGFTVGHSRSIRSLADGEFMALGPALGPHRLRFKAGPVRSRHKGTAPVIEAPPKISAADSLALLRQVPATRPAGEAATQVRARGRRGRDWRPEEDAVIRDGYARGAKIAEIGAALAAIGYSTSTSNISMRAHALGLTSAKAANAWSDEEDQILRDAYAREVKIIDIVGLLERAGFHRGRVSVQMRAIALGITRDRVNYWTEPEKAIALAGLESGKPYREIVAELRAAGYERGMTSILKFAQKNNFNRAGEAWTAEQIAELKQLYADKIPVKEIAEKLGKPIASVRTRASNLGLKQRLPWTEAERQILTDAEATGRPISDAAADIGRPFPNVYAEARRMGLDMKKFGRPRK